MSTDASSPDGPDAGGDRPTGVRRRSAPLHGHGHSHDAGGWAEWHRTRTLGAVLAAVSIAAVATIVGVVGLWPTGEGVDAATSAAGEIGLATERYGATVTGVVDLPCSYSTKERPQQCRVITFELTEGPDVGESVSFPEFNLEFTQASTTLSVGDKIIVAHEESTDVYFYADRDRRLPLAWLAVAFAAIVIGFGRLRGFLALGAMATTLVVLVAFVGPSVLDGNDPVLVSVVAAAAIAFVSLYLTHGVTPTTTIALAGTLAALGVTFGLSWIFFELAQFSGLATEEALILPLIADNVDVSGLLLGGAVLGALGALDDVTVTQVAAVAELRRHNPTLGTAELTASGIRIGREHIASTVNTLLLAYAGASMPLMLLFASSDQPLVMIANSELISVEIVRTLCGSIGLIAAVPITTALAAAVLRPADEETETVPSHARALDSDRTSEPDEGAPATMTTPETREQRREVESDLPPEPPVAPRRRPRWEDFGPEDSTP